MMNLRIFYVLKCGVPRLEVLLHLLQVVDLHPAHKPDYDILRIMHGNHIVLFFGHNQKMSYTCCTTGYLYLIIYIYDPPDTSCTTGYL